MEKKEKTIYAYKTSLGKLKRLGVDIWSFKYEDLEKYFIDNKLALTTRLGYISAVMWELRNNGIESEEKTNYLTFLSNFLTNRNYEKNEKIKEQLPSQKEMEKFVTWETVLRVYKKLYLLAKEENSILILTDLMILALYVNVCPRRNDYANFFVNNNAELCDESKIIKMDKIYDEKYINSYNWKLEKIKKGTMAKNYYVKRNGKSYFVFNEYKTSSVYGRITLEINNEFVELIDNYINIKKIENNGQIFIPQNTGRQKVNFLDNSYFSARIRTIFMYILGYKISSSALRHIFIIDFQKKNPTPLQKAMVARCMGHNIDQQDRYAKKGIFDDISEEDIEKGIQRYKEKKNISLSIKIDEEETDIDDDINEEMNVNHKFNKSIVGQFIDGIKNVFYNQQISRIKASVYKISNDVDDLIYIGSTFKTIEERLSQHKESSDEYTNNISEHMEKNKNTIYKIEIVEELSVTSQLELTLIEDYYICHYNSIKSGLNMKYNNAIISKILSNEVDYNEKYSMISKFINQYEQSHRAYHDFIMCNGVKLSSFVDDINFNKKNWINTGSFFQYQTLDYFGRNCIFQDV